MIKIDKKYNGKLLLFGEYAVIHGSSALAIPVKEFNGSWNYAKTKNNSHHAIVSLKNYLLKKYRTGLLPSLDFDLLEREISKGLFFDSTIPSGYGLGSSGALVAAIFDSFILNGSLYELEELKHALGTIESYFHGSSSGTDPLVSLMNQGLIISDGSIELTDDISLPEKIHLFLIDSEIPRQTAPLVKIHLDSYEKDEHYHKGIHQLADLNQQSIDAFVQKNGTALIQYMKVVSKLQLDIFHHLIPTLFIETWEQGLMSGDYFLKICGAGAGGYILGLTPDPGVIEKLREDHIIHEIKP